jgi:cyanophycin synthetase
MKLGSVRALPGPNVYVSRPVLQARIELEDLTEKETTDFPGFSERLLAQLPGLREHHCAKGAPGGFVERLRGGTYFGHVVEHVTLELGGLVGAAGNFGRTVYAGAAGRYDMIMEYRNEPAMRFLLPVAVALVEALLRGEAYGLEVPLQEARRIVADTDLGPSTRAIVEAAERRGIPWFRLTEGNLVQLGYGVQRQLVLATQSERTSIIGVEIAGDKDLTKRLLDDASIPVPKGIVVRSRAEAVAALANLTPPLAVKPLDGNQGKGVTLQVQTEADLAAAYDEAARYGRSVVLEEYFSGHDYRVLVVNGKLVAASERVPAHVVGDGEHTVRELVAWENTNPLRGDGHEKPLTKIHVDEAVENYLRKRELSLDHVPALGEQVFLRQTANLSTGGTARDVTDQIHPTIARMCERAARIVGLDICGIDLIAPDVRIPLPESGAGIVEVNAAPGIRMHHHPAEGQPRDVGAAIVEMLYPRGATGRIPIVAITGTNGKTTVTRMIGHALGEAGMMVGMTTTDGIYLGGEQVAAGDLTGFHSARTVLGDPTVEAAVLETARGGIVRRSLGWDWADVGVLTNVQADHLGQDGIETIDDLLWVKSLVAERVREGGTLVLNADDERLARLPEQPRIRKLPRQVVFFSLHADSPVVGAHRDAGGTAYYLDDGWLVEAAGATEWRVAREAELPVTLGGAAKFQTANALAALAAARALGLPRQQAAAALMGFRSNAANNGRMNLYRVERGYVIVDYGHNVGAFDALCGLRQQLPERRFTGVFTVPGDRPDELIDETARQAARCFDRLIIREDEDLRGRQTGEVAERICAAVRQEAPDKECLIILQEGEALETALREMDEGDVVVFFFEKQTTPSLEILKLFGATPADAIEPLPALQAV